MRTNTELSNVYKGIRDMFDRQMPQDKTADHQSANIKDIQKKFLIESLCHDVRQQKEDLIGIQKSISCPPDYFYDMHEQYEMPRFISMQPNKETGLYHETTMDGAASLYYLTYYAPSVGHPEYKMGFLPYDFLDVKSVLNDAKKESDQQNTLFVTKIKSIEDNPIIVREIVTKDRESGLERVDYYKTVPVEFVENGADGTSKVQPRLYQRLGGITQDEANSMYRKAEEIIVQRLAENHPEAFARLTEDQQKYKILPKVITDDAPIHIQKAMLTKEYTHAFIAIQTHKVEANVKEPHVSFLANEMAKKFPEKSDFWPNVYHEIARDSIYEIALNAQNVAEETTALVLGKRIQQTVEKEKAQAAARNREQEAAGKAPAKTAGTFLGAFATVANAAVKRVKIERTRSKAVTKVKEKDQGLDL